MMAENNLEQPTQSQPPQPAEEPMAASQAEAPKCGGSLLCSCKCLRKLLFVLLGLILVGGLVWVAYSMGKRTTAPVTLPPAVTGTPRPATPTLDETAGWKTYTNEEYKYQIQYPNNWSIKEDRSFKPLTFLSTEIISPDKNSFLDIQVEPGIWEEVEKKLIVKAEKGRIGSIEAFVDDLAEAGRIYTFPSNVKNQIIQITYGVGGSLNITNTLDQILSTFKFLD